MKFAGAPDVQCLQRDAIFPGEVHWGTRCSMFVGHAIFPGEVHWGTRCPIFAGDAIFTGEVHWGASCPMFAGDAYSPVMFTGAPDAQFLQGIQMPSPANYPASWYAVYYVYSNP